MTIALVAADTAAAVPTVSVSGVSADETVATGSSLNVGANAGATTSEVKWYLDGLEVAWDGAAPWQATVPAAKLPEGRHTLFSKAYDATGWGTSTSVSFVVGTPLPVPSEVAVTAPAAAATLSGTVDLGARASDPSGIRQMKWYVDGREVAWDGSAPWDETLNTTSVPDGAHTITARAENGAGIWLNSAGVQVTVANLADAKPIVDAPPPPPTDPAGWRLLMSDDFDGPAVDTTKWRIYGPNWAGHAGNGLRDGRAVSIQNGRLTITAQMLDGVLVSGGIKARLSQAYGRYSFRARVDADPSGATTGCVLTWPTDENWPAEGENNIWETTTASRYPFSSFIHYSPQNWQYWFHHYADGTQWHDMAMEWEPNEIRIYRDGVEVFNVTDTYAIPDWPHNLTIQLDAVKPWMSGAVRMEVDNVRVYARA